MQKLRGSRRAQEAEDQKASRTDQRDTASVDQASQRVHQGRVSGLLPQGIPGLQGASVLDPPEHGLSFQSERYSVLPEDQYGV